MESNKYMAAAQVVPTISQFKPMDKAEEDHITELLVRSRVQMLMAFPFFGILSLNLGLVIDYGIATAATDGHKLYFNPYFIKGLSEGEKNWVVVHEIMHPALKHLWRQGDRMHDKWNYAADYAIHSIMMQFKACAKPDAANQLQMPKGCLYDAKYDNMSAEEIYDLLPEDFMQKPQFGNGRGNGQGQGQTPFDDHSKWKSDVAQANAQQKEVDWDSKMVQAAKASEGKMAGNMPGFMKRLIGKITEPQKNWRVLLQEFCQPEIDDYSFAPPDKRFDGWECMLPDFNDTTEVAKKLKFWIDTSGSIGDAELAAAYSEIMGAIHQFNGKLEGDIGFFDSVAYPTEHFENVQDVLAIRPKGGGGTDFRKPFEWMDENCKEEDIAGIIMLTDGYDAWPDEKIAKGKPVLWLINNEHQVPPWGLHATIKV